MKALTLWQPWASLVAGGHKRVETRTWSTKYRGPLAIHAAASISIGCGMLRHDLRFSRHTGRCLGSIYTLDRLPRGAVLAVVNLVAVEFAETVRDDLSEQERAFGNFEDGRY